MILGSIGAAYALSVFVGTYQRFLPVFAKEVLDLGPDGLGLLMAAPGLGAVGSIVIGGFATLFGVALGLALTSVVSLTLTTALFYRLLRPGRRE